MIGLRVTHKIHTYIPLKFKFFDLPPPCFQLSWIKDSSWAVTSIFNPPPENKTHTLANTRIHTCTHIHTLI